MLKKLQLAVVILMLSGLANSTLVKAQEAAGAVTGQSQSSGDEEVDFSVDFDTSEFEEFGTEDFAAESPLTNEEAAIATGIAALIGACCAGLPALVLGGIVGFLIGRRRGRA